MLQATDVGTLMVSEERRKNTWMLTAALTAWLLWGEWWQHAGMCVRLLLAKKAPDVDCGCWWPGGYTPIPFHVAGPEHEEDNCCPYVLSVGVGPHHHCGAYCFNTLLLLKQIFLLLFPLHLVCPNYRTTLTTDSFCNCILFSQSLHNHDL